ncbi:MAG: polyprenyl synthetase family protein [Planctomycetota bacterium]|nr:polyprenyl synthetase family protein [Planctomycetota bacterium]
MPHANVLLEQTWESLRLRVEDGLLQYLEQDADCPPRLREAMSYSLMAGGKRLRPVLVMLACEACGGDAKDAMPAACAIEMVHSYSLIHDDLPAMDDDDLRRGKPTNHVQFDEATAILAGDALLTLAFEILAADVRPADVAAKCCADLASAAGCRGMVAGQVVDLEGEASGVRTIEHLESIHKRKTGRLLTSSLTLGARIGGANVEMLDSLRFYGQSIGLAFQIADDLLDVTGDVDKMGKQVRKDSGHGKLTYPELLGIEGSRARARALVDQACQRIAPFGERGRRLEALANFTIERDH